MIDFIRWMSNRKPIFHCNKVAFVQHKARSIRLAKFIVHCYPVQCGHYICRELLIPLRWHMKIIINHLSPWNKNKTTTDTQKKPSLQTLCIRLPPPASSALCALCFAIYVCARLLRKYAWKNKQLGAMCKQLRDQHPGTTSNREQRMANNTIPDTSSSSSLSSSSRTTSGNMHTQKCENIQKTYVPHHLCTTASACDYVCNTYSKTPATTATAAAAAACASRAKETSV